MAGSPQTKFLDTQLRVLRYAALPRPQVCIETGTYQGDGSLLLAKLFRIVHTIELSDKWFEFSSQRLVDTKNIVCHHGDSANVLEQIIPDLTEPAVFFLDAHFAGGDTAWGKEEVPLLRELQIISQRPYCDLVIIDDLRLVGKRGTSGIDGNPVYPLMTFDWTDITMDRIANIINHANRTRWVHEEDRIVIFRNLSLGMALRLNIMILCRKIWVWFRTSKK